ncbi:hypothetical protein [Pseudoalteromonas sp. RB2-MNA-CIBAN-0110]|uniref:hypothetical protein n=1 Tax=Pseudoalteromonas sp. RB2-MNA-CIBAN-0110 TaxID=3140439 RepID=UPI00331EBCCE
MTSHLSVFMLFIIVILNFTAGSYIFNVAYGEHIFQLLNFVTSMVLFSILYITKLFNGSLHKDEFKRILLVFFILIFVLISWTLNGSEGGFGYFFSLMSPLIIFLSIFSLIDRLSIDQKRSLIVKLLVVILFFLLFESISRIFSPVILAKYIAGAKYESLQGMMDSDSGGFYIYKILSYLRFDSNGVGVIAFLAFSLSLFLNSKYDQKALKIISIILFVIVVLSFSRAAILVSIILIVSFYSIRFLILFSLLATLFGGSIYGFFFYGGSFDSKFEVFINLIRYLSITDGYDLMLGKGLASDIFNPWNTGIDGVFGHSMIVFLIYYIGLVPLLFYLALIIPLKLNVRFYIFLCLFFILGFSYLRPFEPFIFIIFPFICYLGKEQENVYESK